MKAVILAGGLGTRLSEETDRIPKPMVEIGGRPIIWHIMKTYAHYGVREFIVCLGYKGYLIKEYFSNFFLHNADITVELESGGVKVHDRSSESEDWRVTLIDTGADTQTGGRLRRVKSFIQDGTFCMTYGDGVSDIDINAELAFHQTHGRKATVSAITPPGRFGLLDLDGDRVHGFAEKVDNVDARINGGFFILEPSVVDYIDGDSTIWEKEPIERLAREGELMAFQHGGFWQPMDTLRDKRQLEELWAEKRAPWRVWN